MPSFVPFHQDALIFAPSSNLTLLATILANRTHATDVNSCGHTSRIISKDK